MAFVTCNVGGDPCLACPPGQAIFPIVPMSLVVTGICVPKESLSKPFDYPPLWLEEENYANGSYFSFRKGGPGWFISNNILEPCPAGSYCPFNETAGYYDRKVKCTSGEFCIEKVDSPHKCSWFNICNGKVMASGAGGGLIIGIFLVVLFLGTMFTCRRRAKFLENSKQLALIHADDDVEMFGAEFANMEETKSLVVPASIEFENIGLELTKSKDVILDGVCAARPLEYPHTHHHASVRTPMRKTCAAGPHRLREATRLLLDEPLEARASGVAIAHAPPAAPRCRSGRIPPSSLVALMGPSGCGKTTFMNTLLKNTPYGKSTGRVSVNNVGSNLMKDNLVGFVPQDDIVHGNLTVFQNLYYNAVTRLPAAMPLAEKKAHVQHCIKVLGLEKVQNALVGTPEKRGVSGGQKKRVNIGMELVAMPSFLFMDEPTSGLDGAATVSLARCMSLLRKSGLTIICVIHQPRWLVFSEFTHVLLLGEGGKTVFWGRQEMVVPYLESLGFSNAKGENPADWMIDVCSGLEERRDPATGELDTTFQCPKDLFSAWEQDCKPHVFSDDFQWTKGDPTKDEVSRLPRLQARKGASIGQSLFHLTDRAFHSIDASEIFVQLLMCVALAAFTLLTVLLTPNRTKEIEAIPRDLTNSNVLYYLVIVVQARGDYGGKMLETMRELNAGVSLVGTWFGILARTLTTGFLKAFIFTSFRYAIDSPMQNFGTYFLSYLLGTWAWSFFAQWVRRSGPRYLPTCQADLRLLRLRADTA